MVGTSAKTLTQKHSVSLFLPLYKEINRKKFRLKKSPGPLYVPFGTSVPFHLWQAKVSSRLHCYFIDHPGLFGRPGLYGYKGDDFQDNDIRFAFYCYALFVASKKIDFQPSVIHCHDWQAALIPAYLKLVFGLDPFFAGTKSVLTVHNNAYLGLFPSTSFRKTWLPDGQQDFQMGFHISFLKGGIVYADVLNTVSPTYRKEILTKPEFGCGLEKTYQQRKADFWGILNGLDVDYWDTLKDPFLIKRFGPDTLALRDQCKMDLQKEAGISVNLNTPVLGFVGRIDSQKGIDVLVSLLSAPKLKKDQFVVLGQGDAKLEKVLFEIAKKEPRRIHVENEFSESLAHKIYAGCDLFLMPSRFEPCGLSQMIAMRYGALPVVTPTGGLKDTVVPASHRKGTGFIAKARNASAFQYAVREGLAVLDKPSVRHRLRRAGMKKDFSWDASIKEYCDLYEKALAKGN